MLKHLAKLKPSYSVLLADEQLRLVESIRAARQQLVVKKGGRKKPASVVNASVVKKVAKPRKPSTRKRAVKLPSLDKLSTQQLLDLLGKKP